MSAPKWKQPQYRGQMEDQQDVLHPCAGILHNHEQDSALTYTTMWKDLEDSVLSDRTRHKKPLSV
jgi:hypothetical protein